MTESSTRKGDTVLGSILGALGASSYFVGDLLLLGGAVDAEKHPLLAREDVDVNMGVMLEASPDQLRAGALCGVMASPLWFLGVWDQYQGLRGDRRHAPMAAAAGLLLSSAYSMASFMHASWYATGMAFQAAEKALVEGADEAEIAALVRRANHLYGAIHPPYIALAGFLTAASVVMTPEILRGRTDYPRWAAALVPPALPVAAAAYSLPLVGKGPRARSAWRIVQGSGISVGLFTSFLASALTGRRRRR